MYTLTQEEFDLVVSLKQERDDMEAHVEALAAELDSAHQRYERTKQFNAAQLEAHQAELAQLRERCGDLERAKHKALNRVDHLSSSLAETKARLTEEERAHTACSRDLRASEATVQQLKQQHEALKPLSIADELGVLWPSPPPSSCASPSPPPPPSHTMEHLPSITITPSPPPPPPSHTVEHPPPTTIHRHTLTHSSTTPTTILPVPPPTTRAVNALIASSTWALWMLLSA